MILRVLLASGSSALAEDARDAFGEADVLVATARDPESMWTHLDSRPCDVVLVDRAFLGADPAPALARLAGLPDAPEAIVLVAEDHADQRAELLEAGALGCVGTDVERQTLYRTLRALFGRAKKHAVAELVADDSLSASHLGDFASKSRAMKEFLATVRKVVRTGTSLLILGETGVGKEYLARAVHRESPRGARPFIAVNCAALPEPLLESELFGHVAGAFTGAQKSRRGYFELAHGGTIFLDEIGEMHPHLQVKLLRAIQEKAVQPVGSERPLRVDVRVMAASNRDLKGEMECGHFRSDLYYRLGVVSLTVPPLRARREDIPDLVTSHIEHFRQAFARPVYGIRAEAMERLVEYAWPGNVRELINVIERAVLLAEGDELGLDDLPDDVLAEPGAGGREDPRVGGGGPPGLGALPRVDLEGLARLPLHEARESLTAAFERAYLHRLLTETQGRIGQAAARAGITSRSLYDKMKRLGLAKESYRDVAGPRR